jgi:hypothetical protein
MDVIHQLMVREPSTYEDHLFPDNSGLVDAAGTGLDRIETFLNPPAVDRFGRNK